MAYCGKDPLIFTFYRVNKVCTQNEIVMVLLFK